MEQLIKEMNEAIEKFGLESKEALEASQRLDKAIVDAQRCIYDEYRIESVAS